MKIAAMTGSAADGRTGLEQPGRRDLCRCGMASDFGDGAGWRYRSYSPQWAAGLRFGAGNCSA